jgi:hypothetical protein
MSKTDNLFFKSEGLELRTVALYRRYWQQSATGTGNIIDAGSAELMHHTNLT